MEPTQAIAPTGQTALDKLLADPSQLKDYPIETVERLFSMHKELQAETARRAFNEAFNRVQQKMTPVVKKGRNKQTGSFYARAQEVVEMVHPILVQEGFSRSLSMDECPADNHNRYVLILRHNGGHLERHWMDAPIDDKGMAGKTNKTRLHGTASSYTYCQNQLLCKVLGVPLVDDDGNAGAGVGPGSEAITLDQSLNLEALMDEVKGNRPSFLKLFAIKQISDLPAGQYRTAVRMLEAKR